MIFYILRVCQKNQGGQLNGRVMNIIIQFQGLEKELDPHRFILCHRSYIINLKRQKY